MAGGGRLRLKANRRVSPKAVRGCPDRTGHCFRGTGAQWIGIDRDPSVPSAIDAAAVEESCRGRLHLRFEVEAREAGSTRRKRLPRPMCSTTSCDSRDRRVGIDDRVAVCAGGREPSQAQPSRAHGKPGMPAWRLSSRGTTKAFQHGIVSNSLV